jgi:hypothetical protein
LGDPSLSKNLRWTAKSQIREARRKLEKVKVRAEKIHASRNAIPKSHFCIFFLEDEIGPAISEEREDQ